MSVDSAPYTESTLDDEALSKAIPADIARREALTRSRPSSSLPRGLAYELLIATVSSYLLGSSVTQFSISIGIFIGAMGIGSHFSQRVTQNRSGHSSSSSCSSASSAARPSSFSLLVLLRWDRLLVCALRNAHLHRRDDRVELPL